MRSIELLVGNTPGPKIRTWGYPRGSRTTHYLIPTYAMTVTGIDGSGKQSVTTFNTLRFGVLDRDGKSPKVVGLANRQTHTIKQWIPTYRVHSANSPENGAWQVYDNFLIHDGPDHAGEIFASIGCVEVMGPKGFVVFNDLLISLSGVQVGSREDKLKAIGNSGRMKITYLKATRPPLERA